MARMFVGARLRRLRDERGLSQAALARRIDLSTSYVNQLENDQRPITVPVLLTLSRVFDLDADYFASDGDARLVADLADVLAAQPDTPDVSRAEIAELIARMPAVGTALVNIHRRLAAAESELEAYRAQATGDPARPASTPMPFEEVRDFFYDRRNHIDVLDRAAEQIFADNDLSIGGLDLQLAELLERDHGIRVSITHDPDAQARARTPKRRYDPTERVIHLAGRLTAGQRAFQLATQLAFHTQSAVIDEIVAGADDLSDESMPVARIGLANYFAGALLLPYEIFRRAAESAHYDIELLSLGFEVGFETICHRLSTLQRPGSRGIPFILVRVDRAGNISKRQSATAFHFSRVGGSCPLWVVHDAFATPGRIVTQVSAMPDGRSYFWLARTTSEHDGFLAPNKSFAIGLGCDVAHAGRLVYSTGIDLADPRTVVPIGAGCKVCDRPACPQRAFPQLGRQIHVDPRVSDSVPYRPLPDFSSSPPSG
ncbi:short-chain fatty acyl-CoA regulator family protein [Gordonia sp. ABSL11-1]|uniref:short-chain fatty acyl-CoA regulator family protein n=1 Tax=Gordonia sp. ABSL11-1 TaxID=3053924 RepID=UPI0025724495|nr:short-chain fatty acyl-CoA regulator family protein [Gordonia sp. ABSL11-1]MDL9945955.1 short-chain fatty acyl-CoA regulator family protein [Gordonia sp. ABSL11-1]